MRNIQKVLLIHPEIARTKYNFAGVIDNEPLELETIAAMLEMEGIEWKIWDGQVEQTPAKEVIETYAPDLLYVCGRTRQENFMLEYCRAAKACGDCVTVVGGLHAQQCYERFYRDEVDCILTSFDLFLLRDWIHDAPIENLPGLCVRQDGTWVHHPAVPFNIQRLPRPNRSYFYTHADRYRYLELLPCAHVRTAYGCPFRCSFCMRNRLNCGQYTAREIGDVVDEIEHIDCENIYLVDDDFLIDHARVAQFIHLVRERGIHKRYVCYGRADFIASNPALMRDLKEIGFYYILTGLEASNAKQLNAYHKQTSPTCNENAIRILHEVGIHMMGMLIADLNFTAKDFRAQYRWICAQNLKHVAISILTPEMHSPLWETYQNRLLTHNPEAWDYLHVVAQPEHLTVRQYYFHYHVLLVRLFLRGWRDGIYDFLDYGYYLKSFLKNMFRFGG